MIKQNQFESAVRLTDSAAAVEQTFVGRVGVGSPAAADRLGLPSLDHNTPVVVIVAVVVGFAGPSGREPRGRAGTARAGRPVAGLGIVAVVVVAGVAVSASLVEGRRRLRPPTLSPARPVWVYSPVSVWIFSLPMVLPPHPLSAPCPGESPGRGSKPGSGQHPHRTKPQTTTHGISHYRASPELSPQTHRTLRLL